MNATMKAILRFIEAAWCAVFIVVPSVWYTMLTAWLIYTASVSDQPDRAIGNVIPALIVILGVEVFYGVAFTRYLLRLIPSHFSKTNRYRHGWRLLFLAGCMSPLIFVFIFLPPLQIALGISLALWLACVLIPLFSVERKRKGLSRGKFIVFLRRFSTFADRGVIGLVLSQAPPYMPVVYLIPNRSQLGDWNPYLVGFAGLKFLSPVSSMPLVLSTADLNWEAAAESLIDSAHLIVLDVSQESAAIQTEMTMIERASRWHDAICVKDGAVAGNPALDDLVLEKGGWFIRYKTDWRQIVPRLIVLLLLSVVVFYFLYLTLTQRSPPTSELEQLTAVGLVIVLFVVPFLSGVGLLVYSTFVFPTLALSTKQAIRKALRNEPSDERLIRKLQQHQQEFERLISMSFEEATNVPTSVWVISVDGTFNNELVLSSERRDQYLVLFQLLGIRYIQRDRQSDSMFFTVYNHIAAGKGCAKGYVYTRHQRLALCDSLDIKTARGKYFYRKFEQNWYLYLYEK